MFDQVLADASMTKISDLVTSESARPYIVEHDQAEYRDEWPIPVLTANPTFLLGYTNIEDKVYEASKEDPVIILDDYTTKFQWVDFRFKPKSRVIQLIKANENVSLRYLYWVFGTVNYKANTYQGHWGRFSQSKIPLPPLVDQIRIADFLDRFSEAIRLQEEQIELLKLEKKVLMDRIFAYSSHCGSNLKPFSSALTSCKPPGNVLSSELKQSGSAPVIDQGRMHIAGYVESDGCFFADRENPVILFGDHTTKVDFIDFSFLVAGAGVKLFRSSDEHSLYFLFTQLLHHGPKGGSYGRHSKELARVKLWLPNLEVQEKIAYSFRLLDRQLKLSQKQLELLKLQQEIVLSKIFE